MRAAATRSSRGALAGLVLAAIFLFVGVPVPGSAADAPASAPATLAAAAPTDTGMLTTPEQRARYQVLAEQLRCLVCQNQTLADSNAELAADLRRQVETMILAGRSDSEIKSFLVERYGDFVLYRPPMQQNTWLLWIGPFALLVVGALVWWRIQRRGRAGEAPDLERARRLLDE
ncbi:MAG TPA: cytochrome c-type biogenesis protein CcmH [Burkholderiaceae bacterium]|jgi:cytochrome c-type biogenesis protein CcmH|nr:cytochrome c-type biogenesis protein CcmH [Burkholderiaceae bacterium]